MVKRGKSNRPNEVGWIEGLPFLHRRYEIFLATEKQFIPIGNVQFKSDMGG